METPDKNESLNSRRPLMRKPGNELPQTDIQSSHSPLTKSNKQKKPEGDSLTNSNTNTKNINNTVKKIKKSEQYENAQMVTNPSLESKVSVKKEEPIKKTVDIKYIVGNIENIFANLKQHSMKYLLSQILLFCIIFMIGANNWSFIFLGRSKLERNYCYTKLNQFDSCSKEEVCSDYGTKFDILLYDDEPILKNNDKYYHSHEYFIEENNVINKKYRPFFVKYYNELSNQKVFSKLQINTIQKDKTNFAIILINQEKWNLFYKYFSMCESERYYILFAVGLCLGGIIFSLILGFIADFLGRKITIQISLILIFLNTLFMTCCCFYLDSISYDQDFYKNYNNDKNNGVSLKMLYVQERKRKTFKDKFFIVLVCQFIINGTSWSLLKNSLILLVENCTSELEVLVKYRQLHFIYNGIPPFFITFIITTLNDYTYSMLINTILLFILTVCSFFFLDESLRYNYEYCEWEKLSKIIFKFFKISPHLKLNNKAEFENIVREENKKNFSKIIIKINQFKAKNQIKKKKNSYFNEIKLKHSIINRNVKRRIEFVIKLDEVRKYPTLIYSFLSSNRTFQNSKMLLVIVVILLYLQLFMMEKEMIESPFFTIKDLYLDYHHNYILNSCFFILILVLIASNYFYYALYRINCFKTVIFFSLIMVSICLLSYHYCVIGIEETPIDLNQYDYNMIEIYKRDKYPEKAVAILFMGYFCLNGVIMYINLLMLKISKTIYRGIYCAIQNLSVFVALALSEGLQIQLDNYFLFLSIINILCLITLCFLSEFKEIPYLINDLKLYYNKEKDYGHNN